ncbi:MULTISPECIES: DUF6348 family protein [Pseudomonas aeruginosa group]|uniref:Uncharacterized protein n=3 Tax=Pseudomonas aeruginosa group TaxID=136841 RepID=A0ABD7K9J7_PSEAI|nr:MULTISPECIES: DUF6348 family protein [Pseudomonas aeruginosa group]KFF33741.1 hypothetical protein G039_0316400 [Pseudomonas aeruginosa VRFPA01]VTS64065.1 Uncharacterised protein [Streptococcus dysgalactiae subsp. equisimilis]ABR85712.1 hypothetical protein PSPA7_3999 [Pseudomonas aeruginosa PA7]AVK06657.1 hypothetical protein CSB93_5305 [Pseudomonas paraeruginosa]AVR68775.1 hypothetical protein B7D75_18250 [Pseudomonas paraeruginosa]
MEAVSASQHLAALFDSHQIEYVAHGEWVAPNGRLPAIRATWYPGEKTGRLDVDVLLEDERQLQEAFAGIGGGEEGLQDALRNFCSNSLHVLLSVFWGHAGEDQVLVETWEIGERRFEAHIGNLGLRGAEGKAPALPAGLFPGIERAIRAEPLDPRLHWFRHFFCAFGNQRTVEALFDNQPWEAGMQSLAALDWRDSQGYYSVRNFLMLKPLA